MESGTEVLKDAYKIGKTGHVGTQPYNEVVKSIKSGGNFVADSEDQALELLQAAFKDITEDGSQSASRYGYRIDRAADATTSGSLKQGHQGDHINYYNKDTGVKGTITIDPPTE